MFDHVYPSFTSILLYIEIKKKNSISDGSRHRLFEVSAIRNHCDESEKNIVQKVVQDNGFYAHPEHIILAMLGLSIV